MNSFFSSVFTRESQDNIPELPQRNYTSERSEVDISVNDVLKTLSKLKTSKSPGPDGIHCKLIYELRQQLCTPLTFIFNKSLQMGEVPSKWKEANISPISKKVTRRKPRIIVPVSLTSIVCKILEYIIRDKLTETYGQ